MQSKWMQDFYAAWNRRDPAALLAEFAAGGTYEDPLCRMALSGEPLRAHLAAVTSALPELRFTVNQLLQHEQNLSVAWSLEGVCTGTLDGELSAQGKPFVLQGVDLVQLSSEGIQSIRRLFERRELVDQFGLQSIVEPVEAGSMSFGYSLRDWVSKSKPALLGMTWILARDEEEKLKIRSYARQIIQGFHKVPGFIGVVTGFAGLHGFTLTAWESEEALRGGVHGPEHVEAMRAFHQGTSAGVFTSVWQPLRLNRMWLRCTHCGTANDAQRPDHHCRQCGNPLPDAPPYL